VIEGRRHLQHDVMETYVDEWRQVFDDLFRRSDYLR